MDIAPLLTHILDQTNAHNSYNYTGHNVCLHSLWRYCTVCSLLLNTHTCLHSLWRYCTVCSLLLNTHTCLHSLWRYCSLLLNTHTHTHSMQIVECWLAQISRQKPLNQLLVSYSYIDSVYNVRLFRLVLEAVINENILMKFLQYRR